MPTQIVNANTVSQLPETIKWREHKILFNLLASQSFSHGTSSPFDICIHTHKHIHTNNLIKLEDEC